jgi:1-acyl-sn-glycerol-3-phosphate acyltransferase
MSQKITKGKLQGLITILVLTVTTIFCFIPIFFIGFLKLVPNRRWQGQCTSWVDAVATAWCSFNNSYIDKTQQINWDLSGLENLNRKKWYLVVANHQSWLDVVVLLRLFNHKIPTLKFFIKDQLKWVPFLGFAWWAMGCPFMKRYSKDYLAKKPHKKGKDLEATSKAIALFQQRPASVMNFVEGTRYSPHKSKQQKSPYQYLLKPKAGGLCFVISAMGKQFTSMLDVTIIYPDKQHTLWDFLCNRMKTIKVVVRELPIPQQFANPSLLNDDNSQTEFRTWLNANWLEKDKLIANSLNPS